VVGERLRERQEVAAAVPPTSQPVDLIETGSVVGTDTIGAIIEKLDRKEALWRACAAGDCLLARNSRSFIRRSIVLVA